MTKAKDATPKTETRHFYRLRDAKNQIIMLSATANDGDCCSSMSYELTAYGETEARFDSLRSLERVLAINTPWFNSSADCPQWGSIDPSKLTVEHVSEIVTTVSRCCPAAKMQLPVWQRGFVIMDIHGPLDFVGKPIELAANHRVVVKKSDVDFDVASMIAREFFLGERRVYGVAEVTFAGAPGLLVEVDV